MKHDVILTAKGHAGTQKRMEQEFNLVKLWEQPDRAAALKAAAPKVRALAHTGHSKVDAALMDALPKLEIIANFGVGVDQIDLDAAKARGIVVTNTANALNDCVADCAIALVLNTLRKFPQADKYLRAGRWKTDGTYPFTTSLGGKTLGILGLGRIGEEIANRAKAFKMKVRYHNRNRKDVPWTYDPDPVTLAKNSDVLVAITPGGPETDKLVNAAVLDALGPQGYVVNVARGSVVDQPVLLKYLQEGKIAGAGLDVYYDEPNVDPAFFGLDNVVLLPHMASATNETRTAMGLLQIENIQLKLDGEAVKTPVV
ncbi:MAG: 2-hydroxyacid dehydrogenase [Burkholderiales bacterium]|nr:2-hydroxyacid dehydrogenase [Burkholderiales bacterium]MDP3715914.1 2-hydroxyacid dehydrogenase [Burkholderiales bacterium]